MLMSEIRLLIQETCEANYVPELAEKIRFEFNNRFTRCIGQASFKNMTIKLSTKYWRVIPEYEKRDTVIHEACHLIVSHKWVQHGYLHDRPAPHGIEWKQAMLAAGGNPRATAQFSREVSEAVRSTIPRRRQQRYAATCGCMTHQISGKMRAKMLRGSRYNCKNCGNKLEVK